MAITNVTKIDAGPAARACVQTAWHQGSNLQSAGYALHTLADLLGADGLDHNFTHKERLGLLHAVRSIGSAVLLGSCEIAGAADEARESEVGHG